MTDPTADLAKADALLREAKLMLGGSDLADEICAYLATRPEPVDPDLLIAREVAKILTDAHIRASFAALRAIKLAKGERA